MFLHHPFSQNRTTVQYIAGVGGDGRLMSSTQLNPSAQQHTHLSTPIYIFIYMLQCGPSERWVRSINLNEMRAFVPSPITYTHTLPHTHTVSHPPFPLSSPVCRGKHMHLNQLWGAVVTKTNDVVCNIFLLT